MNMKSVLQAGGAYKRVPALVGVSPYVDFPATSNS
jgi:hypothetical protein